MPPNPKCYKCLSSGISVGFTQSTEARCSVENEGVVGEAPTGAAPTTSEWSTIYCPLRCDLYEMFGYIFPPPEITRHLFIAISLLFPLKCIEKCLCLMYRNADDIDMAPVVGHCVVLCITCILSDWCYVRRYFITLTSWLLLRHDIPWHGLAFIITNPLWGKPIVTGVLTSERAIDTEIWCFLLLR